MALSIDLDQRGVAGNNSWGGKPQSKYQIFGDVKHRYDYVLVPFKEGTTDLFLNLSKKYSK